MLSDSVMPSSKWPQGQICDLSSLLPSDSEHDVWSGVGAAASERGAGREDHSSGGETWLHPPQRAVAADRAFSSNNKATEGFPGQLGLSCPLPVVLPELWVLFRACQAALSGIHHSRDTVQPIDLNNLLLCLEEFSQPAFSIGSYSYRVKSGGRDEHHFLVSPAPSCWFRNQVSSCLWANCEQFSWRINI